MYNEVWRKFLHPTSAPRSREGEKRNPDVPVRRRGFVGLPWLSARTVHTNIFVVLHNFFYELSHVSQNDQLKLQQY